MVKTSKKPAFSLAEAMISMLIVSIVGMASVPLLTKSKPQIESVALRGQYGCWYNKSANQMYEWYLDERSPRTDAPHVVNPEEGCKFRLDQRPSNFYIIATGAGGETLPAQVSTRYTHTISNELDIDLGLYTPLSSINTNARKDKTTTVYYGSSAEVVAHGTHESTGVTGITKGNIKSCKLIEGPACAKSCSIDEYINYNQDGSINSTSHKILFDGCKYTDNYGEGHTAQIKVSDSNILYNGIDKNINLYQINPAMAAELSKANSNIYHGKAVYDASGSEYDFKFNLAFYDSSYFQPEQLLGFKFNNSNATFSNTPSKMTQILSALSVRRQSVLTRELIRLNPGAPEKDGAVLILW